MFKEERTAYKFRWQDLGDIEEGRPNLGPSTGVAVYRLMQYSLRDVLIVKYGVQRTNEILKEAGKLAGSEFCKNVLNMDLGPDEFLAELQDKLRSLGIGILRVEYADFEKMRFTLTVSEDLDCSGLPVVGETVCDYDEGFIAGILYAYSQKEFDVTEVDCWASGGRTCRFAVSLKE
ncbi:V4R domain-containing protein [Desulfomonile tiedjei]|uniref:Putative hydrocarbon binding protein (Contains V4R domain) n=1 Tax=Desulfomonile tiedjei (strain ATCC 49306 / DSM 6799 / DCB-1) TaxID=706587 RepID=I4C9B5_DESTA|nr:V4R domain-containing protein [Desulfomonile tiedjei]AFM26156.1 putative hydrocarbon binding protein (contains V4R domain) [Desulfomonile tiedjei DSM 6799]